MEVQQPAHVLDERFEFDAPRFYDFEAGSPASPADKWFDTAPDGPGHKPEKSGTTREPFKQLQDNAANQQQGHAAGEALPPGKRTSAAGRSVGKKQAAPAAAAAAAAVTKTPAHEQPAAADNGGKPNIVTSWGGGGGRAVSAGCKPGVTPAAAAEAGAPGSSRAVGKPASVRRLSQEARRVCSNAMAGVGSAQQQQQQQQQQQAAAAVPGSAAAPRSEPPVTRSMARVGVALFSPVPEHRAKYGSPPATRSRAASQKFYTVQKGKATSTRTKAPMSVQQLRHVLAPKVTKPLRSTKPLTLPDDFQLQTSKRGAGQRPSSAAAAAPAPAPAAGHEARSPFKPLAEKVRDFQYKTPPRFKSRPSRAATSKKRSPITRAEAPQLLTSLRSRASGLKTAAECEAEELEQMKREQFRARPVDARVLSSSGQLGVPHVERPRVTEPQPFNLRSDSRAKVRRSHQPPNMQEAAAAAAGGSSGGGGKFRAQPLNRSILDGPTFRPHREWHEATKPVSPELATKRRALETGSSAERVRPRSASGPLTRSQAGHLGASGHGGSSSAVPLRPTQPQPFRLATESRGAYYAQEMAAKVTAEEARAKRMRRVTARPLPVTLDVPVVPPKPDSRPLTLPNPFELRSVARHEDYEQHHAQQLQQEQEAAKRAADFKARPMHVGGPFVVHESDAPLTVPVDPQLATDGRALGRAAFDTHIAERWRQHEEEQRRAQEAQRKADEEAVREYRKKLRFSARPMPDFSREVFFAQPSHKPLTNPQTPNFASKKRKQGG